MTLSYVPCVDWEIKELGVGDWAIAAVPASPRYPAKPEPTSCLGRKRRVSTIARRVTMWFPMDMAPRDGTRFVYLRRVKEIAVGKAPRFRFTLHAMQRDRTSETSQGVWMSGNHSVADHDAHGWWSHSVPILADGLIKLPDDAFADYPPNVQVGVAHDRA